MIKHLSVLVLICAFTFAEEDLVCTEPVAAIKGTVDEMLMTLKEVCSNKSSTKVDVENVIMETFIPSVDVALITQQVLGRQYLGKASDEEQQFLEDLLKKLLARQYAEAFNCHYLGRDMTFHPLRGEVKRYSRVDSNVQLDEKTSILMRYAVRCQEERWRIYDIVIDGLSLSQTYRSQFNRILQQGGVTALTSYLDRKLNKEDNDIPS